MNRSIVRFKAAATVIPVLIAMISGCAHETNRDMDGVVKSIRAEYAAVAPSLLKAAQKVVAKGGPWGMEFNGKPFVETSISSKPSLRETVDPERERETTFTVWAVECIMSYGPPEIGRIDKHLSLAAPFTATVYVPVTASYRRSKRLKYLYRGPRYFSTPGRGYFAPLPIPFGVHSLPKEYPPEVHRLAEKAKSLCLKAERTTDPTKMEVVRFEYLADKAEWVWKHHTPQRAILSAD